MQATLEKLSSIKRRLDITVPATEIDKVHAAQTQRYAKTVNIKGFRPGKAPLSHIQQRFGDEIRRETMSDVIQKTLSEALKEHQLQPMSTPQIELKVATPGQALEYAATFEVLPEIGQVQFAVDQVEKLIVAVTDEDVSRVVEQLSKQYAKWQPVERPAVLKDRLVIDYQATLADSTEQPNKVQDYSLELGSKVMLPGFEDGLIGAKVGDERTLNLSFPVDFPVPERAGKAVDFVVQVKQIFAPEIPELNETFIQKLGVKSGQEVELKQQIRQSLEQERDRLVKEKLKEQIFSQLLAQNAFEVPVGLVEREAKNIHDEIYPQHQQHDHHQHSQDELSTFNDIAAKRVALGLLIDHYVKQAQIVVDHARVEQRIKEIAAVYEDPQEVIKWLSTSERRNGIEAQVIEDQVLDKLLDGVPVTEKTLTYSELKGIRN